MKKYSRKKKFDFTPIFLSIVVFLVLFGGGVVIKLFVIDAGLVDRLASSGGVPSLDSVASFAKSVAGVSHKSKELDESNLLLRIGVISDSHGSTENMKKALALMTTESIDVVVHLGDFTAGGEDDLLRSAYDQLEQSGFDYYTIPGDHDFNWVPEISRSNYEKYFGSSYNQDIHINNVHIVMYENSVDIPESMDRQAWLKKTLDSIADEEISVLFTARPLFNPYFTQKTDPDGEQIISYIYSQNVRNVISGDLHIYSKNQLSEPYEEVTQFTAGAIGEYKNPLPQWLMVEVYDDGEVVATPKPILSF